jgi:hypothetical protein
VAHALGFSVFSRRLLATDLNTETSMSKHYEVCFLFRLQSLCTPLSQSVLNLHSSPRARSILVLVLLTAEHSWTLFRGGFVSLAHGFSATNHCKVEVKVTLRLTVSQSLSLGVAPHLGLMTRYLLLFDRHGLVFEGRPL